HGTAEGKELPVGADGFVLASIGCRTGEERRRPYRDGGQREERALQEERDNGDGETLHGLPRRGFRSTHNRNPSFSPYHRSGQYRDLTTGTAACAPAPGPPACPRRAGPCPRSSHRSACRLRARAVARAARGARGERGTRPRSAPRRGGDRHRARYGDRAGPRRTARWRGENRARADALPPPPSPPPCPPCDLPPRSLPAL